MEKTPEEFRNWIEKKISVEFWASEKDVKVWEFWRYYEGMNIWNEISKDKFFKRPCIILKTNLWNGLVLVAPITSKFHRTQANYYVSIEESIWLAKKSNAIINQIKPIDIRRFDGIMTKASKSKNLANKILDDYCIFLQKKPQ